MNILKLLLPEKARLTLARKSQRPLNRICAAPLLLALFLAGCGGGGGSVPAPLPIATPNVTPFAVLGDSISAGYTAPTTDGSVPTYTFDATHSWPTFASQMTHRPVTNLAIAGGDELNAALQVPNIPTNVTTVIYAGGTNDVAHAGLSSTQLVARIDNIVALVRARVPAAKIVFLNVRRFAGIQNDSLIGPYGLDSTIYAQTLDWNAHEATFGFPIVNIQELGVFDAAAYPDGVHPSPAQVQVLASLMAATL